MWLRAHHNAEPAFATVIASWTDIPADGLDAAVRAAMLHAALRTAVEHYAWKVAPEEHPVTRTA